MATDTIRFTTDSRTILGTLTVDVESAAFVSFATARPVTTVRAGVYTFTVVDPTAGGLYHFVARDSGATPTQIGQGWFVAANDGSTINEHDGNVNTIAWNELATVALPATQASVDDLPTKAELTTALGAADDAVLAAVATRASQTSVDTIDDVIDTEVAAIKAKTDQMVFTVAGQIDANAMTGGGGSGLTAAETRDALGMAAADLDDQLDDLAAAIAAIDTGSGTGPYSVLVTVIDSDSSDPIEGAHVRVQRTGESARGTADVNGDVELGLSAATFTLTTTAAGYAGTSQSVTISGDDDIEVELEATTFTPSAVDRTTGTITVFDAAGVEVEGSVVEVEITRLANGTTGNGIDDPLTSQTTDGDGNAQFTGLPRLATYRVRVDGGAWFKGVTLDAAETPLVGTLGPAVED